MTKTTKLRHVRMLFCAVVLTICTADAQALQIDAVQDTWIRALAGFTQTDYNGTEMSVWVDDPASPDDDNTRHGVVLFDLTATVGLTIDSVYLELWDQDDVTSATNPIVQEAYILGTTPPLPDGIGPEYTWDEYIQFDQATESLLDSLGHYNIAAGDMEDGYEISDLASAADITSLETVRDSNSNMVALILKATSGKRDWGDIEVFSQPPRLVINEQPPVLGDFSGNGTVGREDYDIMKDPANWLETVPAGTLGDMNEDAFVNLTDFRLFKPIYAAANPGSGISIAVPEPPTFLLLCMAIPVLALWHRRKKD